MSQTRNVLAGILVGGSALLLLAGGLLTALFLAAREDGGLAFGDRIALVTVEGLILHSDSTVADLERMVRDPSVRAIVLRLNSPGGAVAPSQEIHAEVQRLRREKKKPIWASIGTVGASGAYYIACAADRVYANPGSVTGSIGVIAEWYNYQDLLKWAKMKDVVFKAGELKDAGSPTREMTPAERKYLQGIIDELHSQFISAVAQGRKMSVEQVRAVADGRIFTGQQAARLGLVDGVADLQQVIHDAARSVGIQGEPRVVTPPRERHALLDLLLDSSTRWLPEGMRQQLNQVIGPGDHQGRIRFQYLWR